jgi:catechol 2,3-dioxygenase-like lactoylglutathione lyase family enzyme
MNSDINYPGSDARSAAAASAAGSIRIERREPIIAADALTYILFSKADLELQQRFLLDFGMVLAERSHDALYMRGTGPLPYFYVAYDRQQQKRKLGKAAKTGYLGIGFSVRTQADLERIRQAMRTPVEAVDGPGGGQRVRLHDPDGFIVDVVWGREYCERIPTPSSSTPVNTPSQKLRINQTVRPPLRPSPVERIGHCVLSVSNFKQSMDWYMTHLGLIPTDVQCLEDGTPALSFNRLDRGEEPADHHTLVLAQNVAPHYMHSAYETLDLDSIGQGQQYLAWRGWKHFWGIGRHILGSQIFDYWLDPEGEELEHYADGDVFDASFETRYHPLDIGGLWAWGDDVPKSMRPRLSVKQLWSAVLAIKRGKLSTQMLRMIKHAMSTQPRPWI